MSGNLSGLVCASCRSSNLVDGKLGTNRQTFVPAGRRWMFLGYAVQAFVCLDCGALGHYLSRQDIDEIRRKRT